MVVQLTKSNSKRHADRGLFSLAWNDVFGDNSRRRYGVWGHRVWSSAFTVGPNNSSTSSVSLPPSRGVWDNLNNSKQSRVVSENRTTWWVPGTPSIRQRRMAQWKLSVGLDNRPDKQERYLVATSQQLEPASSPLNPASAIWAPAVGEDLSE